MEGADESTELLWHPDVGTNWSLKNFQKHKSLKFKYQTTFYKIREFVKRC